MPLIQRELDLCTHIIRLQAAQIPTMKNDVGEMFRLFFDRSPDCMFQVSVGEDGSFRYEAVNAAGLRVTGCSLDDMKGRTPEEVLGPEKGGEMTSGLREACRTGNVFRYQPTWRLPSGTVTYDAGYMPLKDDAGVVRNLFGVARNITAQRSLEAVNYQSMKMDALGKLASGVAHDFNNVLAAQQACFRLLGDYVSDERMQMLIEEGLRSVERGKSLTDQLVAFARQKPISLQRINLNSAVNNVAPLIRRTVGKFIETNFILAADLHDFFGDLNQVEVALLNLAANSRDAIRDKGKITVSTRNMKLVQPLRELEPGEYVTLEIEDNGSGIPPEVLVHILEPFFTTKEPGKGTGLGLSLVHGMVRQFGGDVSITSSVGSGTTICLYFPCVPRDDQLH